MKIKILLFFSFILFHFLITAQETPQIDTQPVDQTVCEGDSAGFVVGASGTGDLTYQWQKNEINIEGAKDSTYIILETETDDSGNYRCIVYNDNGSDTTEVASLTINYVLPTQLLGPHEVENYDTALYSVVYTSGSSYEFFVEQGTVLTPSDTSVHVEWGTNEVGYVSVLETSTFGCYGDTTTRLVIVGDVVPFFLSQPESQTVCLYDSVSFEAQAAGTSDLHYQWQLNGEDIIRETSPVLTIPSVKLNDEGEYWCIVSNLVGIDTSNVAILDIDEVTPSEIYGEASVDVNDTIQYSIVPLAGHQYEFLQTGGELIEYTDTTITIKWDTPGISYVHLIETNTLGCQGDTVNYQVLVFGDGTTIIFLDQPESQGVCRDDNVSFSVTVAGYPELVFQWQKNETNIEGANDSIFSISNVQFEDEAEYRCVVSNDFGSETSDPAQLNVDEITAADILGPQYVEEFEISLYSVAYTEGHVYQFEAEGGNIIESTQNTVTVHWGASGYGKINLLEYVENGCVGEWVDLDIYVGTVGIEPESKIETKVYPNPVYNLLNVKSEGQNNFSLFNILGKKILEEQFKDETRIDLSFLEQGMYLYRIGDRTGRLIKK